MKRLFTITLLILTFMAAKAQIEVSTANEFKNAVVSNNSANIKLKADIDLSSIGQIDITFRGTINGMDVEEDGDPIVHTLGDGTHQVKHPIFKAIEGAQFLNLVIRNFHIDWNDDNIGAVAQTAKNCYFNNVVFMGVYVFNDDDNAGTIVGKAESCTFDNIKGMGNDVMVYGNRAGGYVGLSKSCKYMNCSNSVMSTVYSDGSWGNAYAGGFVGDSSFDQFINCINFATIGALDDRIGGIAGYSEYSLFTGCSNSGYIVHCEEDAFISTTNQIKANVSAQMDTIKKQVEDNYNFMDTGVTIACITLFGSLGAATVTTLVHAGLAYAGIACAALPVVGVIFLCATVLLPILESIIFESSGHDEMGGICGSCIAGIFDTCANYGSCLCYDQCVGGIIGYADYKNNSHTVITNCLNTGTIQGYDLVGGLIGADKDDSSVGSTIKNCLNTGKVTAKGGSHFGHIGYLPSTTTATNNYYISDTYNTSNTDIIGVTAEQLASGAVTLWLNGGVGTGHEPWHQDVGTDAWPIPDFSHATVSNNDLIGYQISSLADLKAFRDEVNQGTKDTYIVYINNDIDCSGYTWEPIGTIAHPFKGYCFGGGHTISNINTGGINDNEIAGFFGIVAEDAEIHSLNIGSGSIKGNTFVGSLVGYSYGNVRIVGCSNEAEVISNSYCGGLIGGSDVNTDIKLVDCYNAGHVKSYNANAAAAFCGMMRHKVQLDNCWNTGIVSNYASGGGFAFAFDATIHNCYNAESRSYLTQTNYGSGDTNLLNSFSDEEAKNGTLCYNLNGFSNDASVGLNWEQSLSVDLMPHYKGYANGQSIVGSNAVYTNRNMSSNYGTIILPYTVHSNEYVKFYVLSNVIDGDETQVRFSAVDMLEAGTPAIFRVAEQGDAYFVSNDFNFGYECSASESSEMNGWTMKGNLSTDMSNMVFTDREQLKSLYYISGDQIKSSASKLTVAPFRAYMEGPSRKDGAAIKAINIIFDDDPDATDIKLIPAEPASDKAKGIYNIAGQQLVAPQKGINIVNGKKVFNK